MAVESWRSSDRKTGQSAGELHWKLPAAQRLPLASQDGDEPLSAAGPGDEDAPLHLALWAPVGHAHFGRGLLTAHGEVVHGETAEQVGKVVEHQGQSLRVRLVSEQNPVQIPDPSRLTEPVALPAGRKESVRLHSSF